MRILIASEDIPSPSMGGLAKHALTLARALVRAGHQVDILGNDEYPLDVAGEECRFGGRFFGELNGHRAGWKENSFGMFIPFRRTWLAKRFARIIMRWAKNYDVVHYHGHLPNVGNFIPAKINFIQTRHDHGGDCIKHTRFRNSAVCETSDPRECASCMRPMPGAIQQAVSAKAVIRLREETARAYRRHKTVFVSDMLRRNFARTMGPGPWGAVIHNFIDRSKIEQARKSAGTTRSDGTVRVFVSGKIYEAKGMEALLRKLAPRMPANMLLTIAGDGRDEARLRREYQSERIRFIGWRTPEQTLEEAARSNAIVVPSIWEEPFGATTLEGLLLGKTVFALERGGTPELTVYAVDRDQLRLHPDMTSLVDDLIMFRPRDDYPSPPPESGSVDRTAQRLLDMYRLPSGPISS